jgi:hypothetical protein
MYKICERNIYQDFFMVSCFACFSYGACIENISTMEAGLAAKYLIKVPKINPNTPYSLNHVTS